MIQTQKLDKNQRLKNDYGMKSRDGDDMFDFQCFWSFGVVMSPKFTAVHDGLLDLLPVRCLGQKNPNIFLPNGGEFNGDESHGRIH